MEHSKETRDIRRSTKARGSGSAETKMDTKPPNKKENPVPGTWNQIFDTTSNQKQKSAVKSSVASELIYASCVFHSDRACGVKP